ncbi:PAS domain S-box protein [Arenibacter sp. BSSL-BM3]|uniref:histidine kinase n=1 Tax=Arenibacter arenosicollis TaxID=2762274 RepID=A0ABR7QP50_9FLAO|nr:PAS domain S-box protein [Arenibacter arenosicollis]MBC8768980.1 PAS domain S-box protein [Arenibacter arenosicollis]
MDKLEKSTKKRYLFFIATIVLSIILAVLFFQNRIDILTSDVGLINIAGRQRMLSQRISKHVFALNLDKGVITNKVYLDSLKALTTEWRNNQNYLIAANEDLPNSEKIDALFAASRPSTTKLLDAALNILDNPNSTDVLGFSINVIRQEESPVLTSMNNIVLEYQNTAEKNLTYLYRITYFIALIVAMIIIGQFILVFLPLIKKLKEKSKSHQLANIALETSNKEIQEKMDQVTALQADLKIREEYNKTFIDKAPNAMAMFDNDMKFLAASDRWRRDYNISDTEITGKSLYEIFPEIEEEWKKIHRDCLAGAIHHEDETAYKWPDGRVQWLSWDIRPWYVSADKIGGLLIYTLDITTIKEKEKEKLRIEEILNKTNQVARIGTWEVDTISGNIHWSTVTCEIHEVPYDYVPKLDTAINFFKEGESRELIQKVVENAIEKGIPYDVEVELITAKGNSRWARAIGQPEMVNGQCVRLYGVFHNINDIKVAENALNKANGELTAIFNVSPISIIGTDMNGLITHFNQGAENLVQYSASEMIGKKTPEIIHLREEVEKHGKKLSDIFGKTIRGFDVFVEHARRDSFESMEWTYVRKDGASFPVQLITTAIKGPNGEINGFLGVATDISETINNRIKLIEAKEDLEVLTKKLTNQNRQLADFAHITSHNLRSPVANLQTLSSFYKDSESEEERSELFEKFEIVIDHLSSTLNTMVEVIQTTDDSTKASKELSFEKTLNKTQEIISSQITQSGAIIKSDFSKAPLVVYNDIYLDSIFLNLISNAIKYKSEDRIPEISVESKIEGGKTILSIRDNGLGINMEKHGHKLFGLNKVFHSHPEAKGVGLYMTKIQVEAMGGSISASSKVGEGSTFTVMF